MVRRILETDRPWSAYALADLAPAYREHAQWHCGAAAVALVYRGFHPPVLFAQGAPAGLRPLIAEIAHEPALYLSVRPEVVPLVTAAGYRLESLKHMLRMVLPPGRFSPPGEAGASRLGPEHHAALLRLHDDGAAAGETPLFYNISMLRHGVYYGIWEDGELAAAAGTHVFALDEGVGGLGNVYTRRGRRGRGLAARATAAVCAGLLRLGLPTIVLNVECGNAPAIRVYERLGFEPHCEFREALAMAPGS